MNFKSSQNALTSASAAPSLKRRALALSLTLAMAGATLPLAAQAAQTSKWPDKPVRLVVGFAPGGGTDIMARAVAHTLSQSTGQTFVVENKPGASGNLSVSEVVRATPDGYTFLIAPTSVESVNPFLFKSDIDPAKDLTPVMGVGRMQMYVVARPNIEVSTLPELIEMAKKSPGKMTYSSSGTGTPPHLAGELFNQSVETSIVHVPYRGSAPALQDVMSSQVDFVFDPGIALPHIKGGKVKLLAVASDRKSPFFPDAPTYSDLGIKNASMDIWFGMWAPKSVPADIMKRVTEEMTKALATADVKERFNALAAEPAPLATQEFQALLKDERETLAAVIKKRNIVVE